MTPFSRLIVRDMRRRTRERVQARRWRENITRYGITGQEIADIVGTSIVMGTDVPKRIKDWISTLPPVSITLKNATWL